MSPERTVLLKEEVDSFGIKTVVTCGPSRVIFFNGKGSEKAKEPALFFPDSYGSTAYIVATKIRQNGDPLGDVGEKVDKSLAKLVEREIASIKELSEQIECHTISDFDTNRWGVDIVETCRRAGINFGEGEVYRVALIAIPPDDDHSWA